MLAQELNIENNLHKQTNKNNSLHSLYLDPGHNTDHLPPVEGNMLHKPSPGTRGLKLKATKVGSPSKKKNSQPFKMSSFSCLGCQQSF